MGRRGARPAPLDDGNFPVVSGEVLDGGLEHSLHVAGHQDPGEPAHVAQVGAHPKGQVCEHGAGQKAREADQQNDHSAVAGVQRREHGRQADAEQDEDDDERLGAVVDHVANDAIGCSASAAPHPSPLRPPVAKKHLSEGFSDEARRKQQIHTRVTPRATEVQCQPEKCTQYAEQGHENGAESAEQEANVASEKLVEQQGRQHCSRSVQHSQLMGCQISVAQP